MGLIYKIALPLPLRRLFDYLPPPESTHPLSRGMRVKVPFGKRELIGIILGYSDTPSVPALQLKTISEIVDNEAFFPTSLCDFIEKVAQYYHCPIGEAAFTGTPLAIRQGKSCVKPIPHSPLIFQPSPLALNDHQATALQAICEKSDFSTFLLDGITGSGKTEVYLQATEFFLKQNKQILILVPEISLTGQTLERFIHRFGEGMMLYHSRLSPKKRHETWLKIRENQAAVIIGTRSALFLPFINLGLIVIYEEHDAAFKQQEGVRYSARDSGILRGKMMNCPVVLGSATPSFETLFNVKIAKYHSLSLPKRATNIQLPEVTLLDVRHKKLMGGLSTPLLKSIEEHCQHGQVLLFINRRGFSPTFMCYACHWMARCKHCDARLTYHPQKNALLCHHCGYQSRVPQGCPDCQAAELHPVGQGTQRIESVLQERFPALKMIRIDSDATRKKGELEKRLQAARNNEAPLLIGTQMLAKGHHFPHLSLVAIVDADGGLFSVDFRAVERMAQLIIQVAGRAGRVHQAGKVLIQSFYPEHPLLKMILQQDYGKFAEKLLLDRQQCSLPPYSHLALVRAYAKDQPLPQQLLEEARVALSASHHAISILGPVSAPMLKRQGKYHYQLLLQSPHRKCLHSALSYLTSFLETSKLSKRVRWSLDVDPLEMF